MKKIFAISFLLLFLVITLTAKSQETDKSMRPSPPAAVSNVLASGALIKIDYGQPSIKGRTIGKDLEPKEGIVWRTGANEATVFETNLDVKINGQRLPPGKYSLFTISGKEEWVIIFNKLWDQWGAYDYSSNEDILRIKVKPSKPASFYEKMIFTIGNDGKVNLYWGDVQVGFQID